MPILQKPAFNLLLALGVFLKAASWVLLCAEKTPETDFPLHYQTTRSGVRYGIVGLEHPKPAPVLFVFAGTIEGTLKEKYFRQCGNELLPKGFILVSLDLPSHGQNKIPEDPGELTGWRWRIEKGHPFLEELTRPMRAVLDELIASGITDSKNAFACGTSRGGFSALAFGASDPRVKGVAAFCPVTDLGKLREFKGLENDSRVKENSIFTTAEKLAGRPVWIVIGDKDERVSTDSAIQFARALTAAALKQGLNSGVDLLVLSESKGHTTPAGSSAKAAEWILSKMQKD